MVEETLVIVKPDGVQKGLIGEVIRRLEMKQLQILDIKMKTLTRIEAEKLYEQHIGKEFFQKLIDFTVSGPVVLLRVKGEEAVMNCRIIVGDTHPERRVPGSIRGDFSPYLTENIVHASATKEEAKKEISIFF